MDIRGKVIAEFQHRFDDSPLLLVQAPGRVNVIGEHTDYSDGFVLPMAINRHTLIALRPREDRRVVLHSIDHQATATFDLDGLDQDKGWEEYPKGVAWALQEAGYKLRGWEGTTICDVPLGAGLSSSASYELAVAAAFADVSGFPWDAAKMALICQKAENQWVGVNCGIMDQMIAAVGEEDKAVLIDCRSLETTAQPIPPGTSIVILDTSTRRGLVDSAYNERRQQCEEAAALLGVSALRDADLAMLTEKASTIPETTLRRARHVITENERTLRAAEAMQHKDAAALGRLMNQSHDSLRDDFEVTNHELDIMADISRNTHGCYGARMTGAGFGGCAVALIESERSREFVAAVQYAYQSITNLEPAAYVCRASTGARSEPVTR